MYLHVMCVSKGYFPFSNYIVDNIITTGQGTKNAHYKRINWGPAYAAHSIQSLATHAENMNWNFSAHYNEAQAITLFS